MGCPVAARRSPRVWVMLGALAAALRLTACAHAPTERGDAPPSVSASNEEQVIPLRSAAVVFEVGGKPTRLPFVRGAVNRHAALFLLDTGSTAHVVGTWFVKKLGIAVTSGSDRGRDHEGGAVALGRAEGVGVELERWGPLSGSSMLTMDLPSLMEERGVAGIISPQALREGDGLLLLVLAADSMRLYPARAGVTASPRGCTFRSSRRCDPPSATDAPLFVVQAEMDGASASLVVDTGDIHSDLLEDSPARDVGAPTWKFGSCTAHQTFQRVPGRAGLCRRDGALGIDVLRTCALRFDADHVEGSCKL